MHRRRIDLILFLLFLVVMNKQVTGDLVHEMAGILLMVVVIIHLVLNRRWFLSLITTHHIIPKLINLLLIVSLIITILSGLSLNKFLLPALYGFINPMLAMRLHLTFAYWTFVLLGMHIGLHSNMLKRILQKHISQTQILHVVLVTCIILGGYLVFKNNLPQYLFMKTHFVMAPIQQPLRALFDALCELIFFAFLGWLITFPNMKRPNH